MTKTMIVCPRADTIKNWKQNNPTPKKHELCCVLTERGKCKWKIGDGKTSFKNLKYIRRIKDLSNLMMYAQLPDKYSDIHYLQLFMYMNPFNEEGIETISSNDTIDSDDGRLYTEIETDNIQ